MISYNLRVCVLKTFDGLFSDVHMGGYLSQAFEVQNLWKLLEGKAGEIPPFHLDVILTQAHKKFHIRRSSLS